MDNLIEKKWSDLTFKNKMSYALCISAFVLGFILLFIGLLCPPMGEISASVITSLSIILTFVGAILGIDLAYTNQLNQFKKEIMTTLNKQE